MPRKLVYKKKSTRRYRKKKSPKTSVRQANTVVSKGKLPLSERFITSLKYVERVALSAAPGGSSFYQFRLNSLHDPRTALGGHQPYGYDQISAMYNRYRVFKCRYRLQFSPSGANAYLRAAVGPQNDAATWTAVDLDALSERSKISLKYLKLDQPTTFTGVVSLPQLCGATRVEYMSDDRYQALTTTDPSEQMMLNFGFVNNSASSHQCDIDVILEYYAEFFDPATLAQS